MINIDYKKANNSTEGFKNLYYIITLLRSEDGCPWDRIQTNKTTLSSLIDECYEYLDGINNKDISSSREELGDILLNAFMELKIHEDQGDFKAEDVLNEVCLKLIRRHPHVFSNAEALSPEEVLTLWNKVKESEHKEKEENIFSHIPSSLPPLERSYEVQKKLKKVGFDFNNNDEIFDKIQEEISEVKLAISHENPDEIEEEIGDLLFSVVNLSRFLKVRPNIALHRSNEKIESRFLIVEEIAKKRNISIDKEHNKELNDIWDEIKHQD